MAPLFQGLRFYLTRSLSSEDKVELKQLIEQNKGKVCSNPAGVMQIVDSEMLDARHPDWISKYFIKDSVEFQTLQDSSQYSGQIFTTKVSDQIVKRQKRIKYTVEDDARMLHFAKVREWKTMQSIPESVWRIAKGDRVTCHSAQSMHEHFRKQLQRKTEIEQRVIMEKAAELVRARMKAQQRTEEEKDEEMIAQPRARSSPTALQKIMSPKSTTPTHASRRTRSSSNRLRISTTPVVSTPENLMRLLEEEKPRHKSKRKRLRSAQSPLRETEEDDSSNKIACSPPAAGLATPETPVFQANRAGKKRGDQNTDGNQQRKHRRIGDASASEKLSSSQEDLDESDADSIESKTRTTNGIFFRSAWTELASDYTKRQMMQRFFQPPSTPSENQANSANDVDVPTALESHSGSQLLESVEKATDDETEHIICQLQLSTRQDMSAVVHAMFYCSGDVEMAESFLKGAVPSGIWSAEDDLLLMNLVAEDEINRSIVEAAVVRGDFTCMQVPRDTDAILRRVHFLR